MSFNLNDPMRGNHQMLYLKATSLHCITLLVLTDLFVIITKCSAGLGYLAPYTLLMELLNSPSGTILEVWWDWTRESGLKGIVEPALAPEASVDVRLSCLRWGIPKVKWLLERMTGWRSGYVFIDFKLLVVASSCDLVEEFVSMSMLNCSGTRKGLL